MIVLLALCVASWTGQGMVGSARAAVPQEGQEVAAEQRPASDESLRQSLTQIFGAMERFQGIEPRVAYGVVTLRGEVPSTGAAEAAAAIAEQLDGVVYVDNQLSSPAEVSARLMPLRERLERWGRAIVYGTPLLLIALMMFAAIWLVGRFISNRDLLYRKLVKRPLLRDITRRITRIVFFVIGAVIALEALDATTLVGTVLGAAGVLGLVIGFAFRDIAENYLASVLLAARRPFALGDTVIIGDYCGKIVRLTMRETVMMTFAGNHVSMPNAQVFKSVVENLTRNPRRRLDFVVGAAVDSDLQLAQALGAETLLGTPGVIADPEPFALIEELGDSNVAIRFHAWVDQNRADYIKVRSEAIRQVKSALEDAGIELPEPMYRVHVLPQAQRPDRAAGSGARRPIRPVAIDVSPDHSIDREIAVEQRTDENLLADQE